MPSISKSLHLLALPPGLVPDPEQIDIQYMGRHAVQLQGIEQQSMLAHKYFHQERQALFEDIVKFFYSGYENTGVSEGGAREGVILGDFCNLFHVTVRRLVLRSSSGTATKR